MTRFGGFLCFVFISLPAFTEHALIYFRVRHSQIVNAKFDTKIFLLYTFPCILEYHNSSQFQFVLCARCKKFLVYVSDYFRVTKS